MIVRTLDEILNTERDIRAANWSSRRLLLKGDGLGFSLHDTLIFAGTETQIRYKHHLEGVYCIEGSGEIVDLDEAGKVYPIRPGTLYALDQHDKHILRAHTDMRLISVFNPPLVGNETHDADGSYILNLDK